MLKNLFKKKKESGFSLVEMVVAMGIFAIFTPVIVGLMNSAILARNTADVATKNIMNASTINILLTRDIESSGAIKVESPEHIKMRTIDNVCKEWKVQDGSLIRIEKDAEELSSNDEIAGTDPGWTEVYEKVKSGTNEEDNTLNAFVYENGTLNYNLILGDDSREDKMNGSITPDVAATSPGNCWTEGE